MNKRIEQLAEQAGMHRDKFGMYFAGDKHNEDGVDLEKFTELLLEECANRIQSNVYAFGLESIGTKGFCIKEIKKLSGGEE